MSESTEQTYGQKAVGLSFNPGGMPEVNRVKEKAAALIDELNDQRNSTKEQAGSGEKIAQYTIAIRAIMDGQMWGVKAATWRD